MIRALSFAAGFTALASAASAATFVVEPLQDFSALQVGESVSLNLFLGDDFPSTLGGTFNFNYDADVFTYEGIDFDNFWFLNNDQIGSAVGATGDTTIENIVFGAFPFGSDAGVKTLIGTLNLTTIGGGTGFLNFTASDVDIFITPEGDEISPIEFENVEFEVNRVPLPPAAALLVGGLALLRLQTRRAA